MNKLDVSPIMKAPSMIHVRKEHHGSYQVSTIVNVITRSQNITKDAK